MDDNSLIHIYISNMTDEEKKTYDIAKSYLKSSFDIVKTIGFLSFKKTVRLSTPNQALLKKCPKGLPAQM